MRVCLVTLGDPGTLTGGYLYHLRMAEMAPAHDAEVTFFSFPDRPFPIPAVSGRRMVSATSAADVVVLDSIAAWCAAPWLRRVEAPVIGMLHQLPGGMEGSGLRRRLQAPLDRIAYRHMTRVMAASQALHDDLIGTIDAGRLVTVAPGRDVATPSRDLGDIRNGRSIALLSVGNWTPRKGTAELLQAFAQLPEDAATLHLVGRNDVDGPYARRITELLEPLRDRVVVHGAVPKEDVAALYEAADAFVLPSYVEPYGTVYGEAMAFGLPVIGWDAGNLPHLARHEESSLIVTPGDIDGLARALDRISRDEALRERLADGARERAQALPTWKETAARFFEILASS